MRILSLDLGKFKTVIARAVKRGHKCPCVLCVVECAKNPLCRDFKHVGSSPARTPA